MRNKFSVAFLIILSVILILTSIFIYKSLLGSGAVMYGDFTAAKNTEGWIYDNFLYLWNGNGYSNRISSFLTFLAESGSYIEGLLDE